MSTLKKNYNRALNGFAPVHTEEDLTLVVKKDKNGASVITFEPIDYKKIIEDNGKDSDWSLNALLAAGINPDMPIHTGSSTRLETFGELGEITADVDTWLASQEKNNNEEKTEE